MVIRVSLKGLYGRVRLQGLYGRVSLQSLSSGDQIWCSGQSRRTVDSVTGFHKSMAFESAHDLFLTEH